MTDCQLPRLKVASSSLLAHYHQLLAILLVTGFALFFVQTATAQKKLPDSEMKEVVRMLIEREVQRPADGGNAAVLLGPNVKSSWIPLGGILQKRWRSHGLLYLDERIGRYWKAILTSEPIEISFNQIDLAR